MRLIPKTVVCTFATWIGSSKNLKPAKSLVPEAKIKPAEAPTKDALLFFGTTASPAYEALETLEKEGIHLNTLRLRSFPIHTGGRGFHRGA
jgi:2-oxoglutarate ferredoxin oxidoreductase subunit alpha